MLIPVSMSYINIINFIIDSKGGHSQVQMYCRIRIVTRRTVQYHFWIYRKNQCRWLLKPLKYYQALAGKPKLIFCLVCFHNLKTNISHIFLPTLELYIWRKLLCETHILSGLLSQFIDEYLTYFTSNSWALYLKQIIMLIPVSMSYINIIYFIIVSKGGHGQV